MTKIRTIIAVGLIIAGVVTIGTPTFGFSSLAADRGVNATTATDQANALLGITGTGQTPDNQNNADVVTITNYVGEDIETLRTEVTLDDPNNALAISNDFVATLPDGETTGLELTCDGGGSGTATVTVGANASGESVAIRNVGFSQTFDYSCTGGGSGPTADSGGAYAVAEGDSVELDGTGSSTSTGNIQSYSWQITSGDGSLSESGMTTPVYSAPSDVDGDTAVVVELTITDNKGRTDTDTTTVTVKDTDTGPTNYQPTADFSYSRSGNSGNVDLDGSLSNDIDGTISSYEWDISNDGTVDATGETVKEKVPAETKVTLTVTDNNGSTDSITETVG